MVRISIFGKQGCAKCDSTKHKLTHWLGRWELDKKVDLVFHDQDTLEGRAEGAFHDVFNVIPVTLVESEAGPIARWEGEIPSLGAVRQVIEEGAHAAAH